ncbi:MAG: hypothetical protein JWQ14_2957 [Adhaeribacter sp.]|nr:hypothetical protein [Adhaeribacter sp.]
MKELFSTEFLSFWYDNYDKLEAYLKQNRNGFLFETGSIDEELLKWIGIQSKIKNKIPLELRNELAALDFDFKQKSTSWEHRSGQLTNFAHTYGHTPLPADDEKYDELSNWLLQQIRGKQYLSESCFTRLDLLGVNWILVITRD